MTNYDIIEQRAKRAFIPIFLLLLLSFGSLEAQVAGEPPAKISPNRDSVIIFQSPRPLIAPENEEGVLKNAWGIDLLFSRSGFGAGVFYHHEFSETLFGIVHLGISGARNTDEFEQFDYDNWEWVVPGKINRLFVLPLTVGAQYRLFTKELSENLKPYIQGGIGPSLIVSTPYSKEFFSSFGSASTYFRMSGFAGVGAYIGDFRKTMVSANIRYYFIPFGGNGLESIQNMPIKDFGGLFLSLSIGFTQ